MSRKKLLIGLALVAAAAAASALLYHDLPVQMPIHWNAQGEVDGYAGKIWAVSMMPGIMLAILGLAAALPWLSPKNFEVDTFAGTYDFVMLAAVGFLGYVHAVILWAGMDHSRNTARPVLAGVFILFALLGNVMGKVRKNFWVGIRVPWTLANDQVWNETHHFAAKLYFWVGTGGFVAALTGLSFVPSIVLLVCAALLPVVYSLLRYKQLEKQGKI